jgi:hypothetical protein
MGFNINWLLTVAMLAISTAQLCAQSQQPDPAKLKADAQKVVSIISSDKAKTQSYCQIAIVGEQMQQAVQAKDRRSLRSWLRSYPNWRRIWVPNTSGCSSL